MFIRRKKIIKMLKEMQLEERESNKKVKESYIKENKKRQARDWQFYEDGCDNVFNWIISRLENNRKVK